jgi:hypothetical protein
MILGDLGDGKAGEPGEFALPAIETYELSHRELEGTNDVEDVWCSGAYNSRHGPPGRFLPSCDLLILPRSPDDRPIEGRGEALRG